MMDPSPTTRTLLSVGGAGPTVVKKTEQSKSFLSGLWLVRRDFECPPRPRNHSCVLNKNGPFVWNRILLTKFDEGLFWLFACACASQGSKILAHTGFVSITAASTVLACFHYGSPCSISSSPNTKVTAAHNSSTCPNTGLSILQVEMSRHVASGAKNLKRLRDGRMG
jgi:hypothetical protein